MYDSVFIEERGKPTAIFVFQYFANDAMSAASSKGMPRIRLVPEPIVSESTNLQDIEDGISGAMEQLITTLTQPLTSNEINPHPMAVENPARIIFKGSLQEVNRFFYMRGWTDGLPVIPPTEEAVAEMLTGTDYPADHLVAKLEPRMGKATVEKIAINAVMAGALPTHMPLLIAGTRALLTNRASTMLAVSTGSWSPFWVVNGPIRKDINLNSSYGAMNPGDIANAAIGRTMGLISKNIRGIRKGMEDMGVLGNPGKYSMVSAENEEDNPWEPLHVEYGFKKEDSTISLTFPQSYQQLFSYGTDAKGLLNTIIYNVPPGGLQGKLGIILTPTNARSLAREGWTKKTIKSYVVEHTLTPWNHHPQFWGPVFDTGEKFPDRKPDELVPIIKASPTMPNPIEIYVFGGMGSWVGLVSGGSHISTEKADLPRDWDKLVAKYKNIKPNYIRY